MLAVVSAIELIITIIGSTIYLYKWSNNERQCITKNNLCCFCSSSSFFTKHDSELKQWINYHEKINPNFHILIVTGRVWRIKYTSGQRREKEWWSEINGTVWQTSRSLSRASHFSRHTRSCSNRFLEFLFISHSPACARVFAMFYWRIDTVQLSSSNNIDLNIMHLFSSMYLSEKVSLSQSQGKCIFDRNCYWHKSISHSRTRAILHHNRCTVS